MAEAIQGGLLMILGGLGKRCWLSGCSLLFEVVLDGHGALRLAMTGWGDVADEVFRHCEALAEAIHGGLLMILGGLGKLSWLLGCSLLFEVVLDGRGALRLAMTGWCGVVGVFRHCEALAEAIQVGSLVMLGGLGKLSWLSGCSLLFEVVLDGRGALRLAMTGWGGVVGVFRHCEA